MGTYKLYEEMLAAQGEGQAQINELIVQRLTRSTEYIGNVAKKKLGFNWRKELPESLQWVTAFDSRQTELQYVKLGEKTIELFFTTRKRKDPYHSLSLKAPEYDYSYSVYTIPKELIHKSCWDICKWTRSELRKHKIAQAKEALEVSVKNVSGAHNQIRRLETQLAEAKSEHERKKRETDRLDEDLKKLVEFNSTRAPISKNN